MESMSPSKYTPEELAQTHEHKIVDAAAEAFNLPREELTLLFNESFESTADPGTISFFLRHKNGLYGVNAKPDSDGNLNEMTTANLQMEEYWKRGQK